MSKKIIILGSAGMAGHVVSKTIGAALPNASIVTVARKGATIAPSVEMDVTDFDALAALIEPENNAVVINCVGLLNKVAEDNPDQAILINSYLPHFLERITKNTGNKIVHISTDCVFSGSKGDYTENDPRDGKGFYAQSKAIGEIINEKDLTIRTSIIGPEMNKKGIGLFHWLSQQQGSIKGYTRAFWSGVTTIELAKAIVSLLDKEVTGLVHLTNGIKISKFELIGLFREVFPKTLISDVAPYEGYVADKSLVNTRPDFDYNVPSYQQMILEMKKWITLHKDLYPHYQQLL